MDASVSIPSYKTWLDIKGIPLELCTEANLAQAVSSFGIFLGSMEARGHRDYHTCSLFIATDDLSLIPYELDLRIGGMAYTATITPRNGNHKPVYDRSDLPLMMVSYWPPSSSPTSPSTTQPGTPPVNSIWFQDDDVVRVNLKLLRDFFKDTNPTLLLDELVACLAGDRASIAANHAAHQDWEQQFMVCRTTQQSPHRESTAGSAASDPPNSSSKTVMRTQHATQPLPQPVFAASSERMSNRATVHHTGQHSDRGTRAIPNLSLLVCSDNKSPPLSDENRTNWEPHLLFPELCATSTQNKEVTLMNSRTNPTKILKPSHPTPRHPLCRTTRGKINKKANSQNALGNLKVQDFVDVPFSYAEYQQILSLIGAADLSIPPNLMDPKVKPAQPPRPPKAQNKGKAVAGSSAHLPYAQAQAMQASLPLCSLPTAPLQPTGPRPRWPTQQPSPPKNTPLFLGLDLNPTSKFNLKTTWLPCRAINSVLRERRTNPMIHTSTTLMTRLKPSPIAFCYLFFVFLLLSYAIRPLC